MGQQTPNEASWQLSAGSKASQGCKLGLGLDDTLRESPLDRVHVPEVLGPSNVGFLFQDELAFDFCILPRCVTRHHFLAWPSGLCEVRWVSLLPLGHIYGAF